MHLDVSLAPFKLQGYFFPFSNIQFPVPEKLPAKAGKPSKPANFGIQMNLSCVKNPSKENVYEVTLRINTIKKTSDEATQLLSFDITAVGIFAIPIKSSENVESLVIEMQKHAIEVLTGAIRAHLATHTGSWPDGPFFLPLLTPTITSDEERIADNTPLE